MINIAAWMVLALLVIAGGFVAGYFLTAPPRETGSAVPVSLVTDTSPATRAATGPHFVIRKAVYGDLANDPGTDVTAKVKAAFDGTKLSIGATNDNFGDTAPGIVKQLRVEYTLDGQEKSRTVSENETLKIMLTDKPARLVIRKAVYGDLPNGPTSDVTERVAAAADAGTLSIGVNNDNFGDPANGIVKKLRVDYTFDGKEKSKTVEEGGTLTISDTGE